MAYVSKKVLWIFGMLFVLILTVGCASTPRPSEIDPPAPIQGNSGDYMSPYTSDGVVAEWTGKAMRASAGAGVGRAAGAYAGQQALRQVPIVGGILGSQVGEAIGREVAIRTAGGWDFIRETSDLSFNCYDDMAVYLYAVYSDNEHYNDVLRATYGIYPQLQNRWARAIRNAPRRDQN